MSKRPYIAQYSSPNIVLVPSESDKEPPVKKLRADSIPLPTPTPHSIQNIHSIPMPQTQHVPTHIPMCGYTYPYNQVYNAPMQANFPPNTTVRMPYTSNDIVPNDLSVGSDQLCKTVKNVNATPKKSWASNYLTSIGQSYKKPIKLNLSSSRRKFNTSNETQKHNTTSHNFNNCVREEINENVNKPQTESREINPKPVAVQQPTTTISQNLNDYVSVEKVEAIDRSPSVAREVNNKPVTVQQPTTISPNLNNYINVKSCENINISQTVTKEVNQKLVTLQQSATPHLEHNSYLSVSSSSMDSQVRLDKEKTVQNRKIFKNTTHLPTLSENTHNKMYNDDLKVKDVNKKSLSLKCAESDPPHPIKETKIKTACDAKQLFTHNLTHNDTSLKSHDDLLKPKQNIFQEEKDSKNRLSNKTHTKMQNIYQDEQKDKYKTKDKQKPSTSSGHKYTDSENKDSRSRKHDGKKTTSKAADCKVSKHKSSQANKDYKILKEIIQDKIKKVRESKNLMELKKKSEEQPDKRLSSDKRSNKKVLSHSKPKKDSERDKRELKIKSTSKRCSPKKETEETSKTRKRSPPIKSVIQMKDNLRKSPLNTQVVDKNFDLRTKLTRRGLSQYFTKLQNAGKKFSEKTKVERDNLIITVQNENNNESTSPDVKEQVAQKVKTKKYKKVKLVINLICENTESSDTDDEESIQVGDTCAMTSEDLSFLDDLNIDEIVDSLNHCKSDPDSAKNTKLSVHDDIICVDDLSDDENSDASTVHLEELDEIQNETSIKRENEQDHLGNITSNKLTSEPQRYLAQNIETTQNQSTSSTNGTIKTEICDDDESPIQETLIPQNEIKKELLDDGCNNTTLAVDGLNKHCSKIIGNMQINDCNKIEPEKQVASLPIIEIKQEPSDDYCDISNNKEIACDNAKTQDLNNSCYKILNDNENLQTAVLATDIKQETLEVSDSNLINIPTSDDTGRDYTITHIKEENENVDYTEKNSDEAENKVHTSEITEVVPDNIIDHEKPDETKDTERETCVNLAEYKANAAESQNISLIANVESDTDMKTVSNAAKIQSNLQIPSETHSKQNPKHETPTKSIELNEEDNLLSDNTQILASSDIIIKDSDEDDVMKMSDLADNKKSDTDIKQENHVEENSVNSKDIKKKIQNITESFILQKQPEVKNTVNSGSPKVENKELETSTETSNKQELLEPKSISPKAELTGSKQSLENKEKSNVEPSNTLTSKIVSNKVDDDELNSNTGIVVPKNTVVKDVSEPDQKFNDDKIFIKTMEQHMFAYLKEPYTVTAIIRKGHYSKILRCTNSKGRLSAVKVRSPYFNEGSAAQRDMLITLQKDVPRSKLLFPCLFKTFTVENYSCFLMECYPTNLFQTLKQVNVLHIDVVQHLSRQLVEAVSVLRSHNIVHADIKPGHILINNLHDRIKLCGFDTAYYIQDCVLKTNIGTVNYRAPEIILGYSADYSVDVWSTALVMFEMATGTQLFPGTFDNDVLFKQMCTLGYMPIDMIKESKFARCHFFNTTFKRKLGRRTTVMKNAQDFYINGILGSRLKKVYYQRWGQDLSRKNRMRDLAKLNSIYNLLEQMLQIHPNTRLPIELVQANPVFDASFSF